jgi:hypothetical protein
MLAPVKLALSFPPKEMWEMLDAVGFGQMPQLGFPGEVTGRLRPWKSWRPIEQATMSYGHGISVSLIQLARAYSVFARDGDLVPLSLMKTRRACSSRCAGIFCADRSRSCGQCWKWPCRSRGYGAEGARTGLSCRVARPVRRTSLRPAFTRISMFRHSSVSHRSPTPVLSLP